MECNVNWSIMALQLIFFPFTAFAELYKMVCDPDETDLDIHIPAVMMPQDAGASLEKMLLNTSSGKQNVLHIFFLCMQKKMNFNILFYVCFSNFLSKEYIIKNWHRFCFWDFLFFAVSVQLYSPRRPVVDVAEVFLWLMAVGTILCASYWSAWSARETAIEQEKLLKVVIWMNF